MRNYIAFLTLLTFVGCTTTKPIKPISIGITHLQAAHKASADTLNEQKSTITKLQITTTSAELTTADLKLIVDNLKALQAQKK